MIRPPDLKGDRYSEIKAWLGRNTETNEFVILDDYNFDWKDLKPYWVKTNYYLGLTESSCNEIIEQLGCKSE